MQSVFSKFSFFPDKQEKLEKFSFKENWEQIKKLDLFCKKLSVNQVNFSAYTLEDKI